MSLNANTKSPAPDLTMVKYGEGHRQGWNDALMDMVDWLRRREVPEGDVRRELGSDLRRALVSAFRQRLSYPATSVPVLDVHFALRMSGHDDGNTNALCGVLLTTPDPTEKSRASFTTNVSHVTCPHCRSQLAGIGRDYGEARRAKRIEW